MKRCLADKKKTFFQINTVGLSDFVFGHSNQKVQLILSCELDYNVESHPTIGREPISVVIVGFSKIFRHSVKNHIRSKMDNSNEVAKSAEKSAKTISVSRRLFTQVIKTSVFFLTETSYDSRLTSPIDFYRRSPQQLQVTFIKLTVDLVGRCPL